ncbi:hypothetical protein TNCT_141701 [Trichonephila clavata]|uniref:Uncharacterized protein n=1 Tax=Trichonephila clavata TaxID=2740835 RepID=A0A8X6KCD1_TRICU|nr:hypothetical protein TNCT_141701 [Trichonephila clavata]
MIQLPEMYTLSASSLYELVKNQRDDYFSDQLREKMVQKISDLTASIETLKQDITNHDSNYKDFSSWITLKKLADNFSKACKTTRRLH